MVKRLLHIAARLRPDSFLLLLGAAILLAFLTPRIGAAEGAFSLRRLADYGVLAIFFFYGVGMSPAALRKGLSNWRLHLLVHLTTFLFFPLIVFAASKGFQAETAAEPTRLLWLGTFYVAALPSTVSSSVVMVSIARGNVPAAMFNASVSGLLGVFLTPLWMSLFRENQGTELSLLVSIRELMLIVVLPVGLGMCLNRRFGEWTTRYRKPLRCFDQGVVLLIVYTSFSTSFAMKAFDGFGVWPLTLLCGGMAALFFVVYLVSGLCCRLSRFNREDTITVRFCGSKKSLMHGMAMSKVLLTGSDGDAVSGVVLLPIMLYHALQLLFVSVFAQRFAADDGSNSDRKFLEK